MIDEMNLNEEAECYAKSVFRYYEAAHACKLGFMAGAEWAQKEFIKSLWHDASEEPDDEKEIIISMNVGTIEEECVMLIYRKENPSTLFANGCRKWCYLSDLLPKGGEK